jgi:hypothetical protein
LAIAKAVRDWLADTFPEIQPFISPDLSKGTLWFDELANQLNDAELGFMCLALPRIASDWQLVEAGAIWKAAGNGRLFPLCFGTPAAVISEPLQAFQSTQFEREDFERLATDIARRIFGRGWTTRDKDAFESAWIFMHVTWESGVSKISILSFIAPAFIIHLWLPLFALSSLAVRLVFWIFRAVEWAQWFIQQGDAHPLKAIGIVATIIVFGSAMLVKEAWTVL